MILLPHSSIAHRLGRTRAGRVDRRARCAARRAARQLEIAVQDDPVFLGDDGTGSTASAFKYLQALGVTRLRVNLAWATAMPPRRYKGASQARLDQLRSSPRTTRWSTSRRSADSRPCR